MHYRNGRKSKVGDPVVGLEQNQKGATGFVAHIIPGTNRCNLILATLTFNTFTPEHRDGPWIGNIAGVTADGSIIAVSQICGTASEFIHAEDAANACATDFEGEPDKEPSLHDRAVKYAQMLVRVQDAGERAGIIANLKSSDPALHEAVIAQIEAMWAQVS